MVVEVGQLAPDFTLESQFGEPVTLSSFAGEKNVLLVFYSRAFAPICRSELGQLRDDLDGYRERDVVVAGVSVDSRFTLREWASQLGFRFPLLADCWPLGGVAAAYGAFDDYTGVARRATFLIDTRGIVRFAEVQGTDSRRDQSAWKAAVADLSAPRWLNPNVITFSSGAPSEVDDEMMRFLGVA